MFQKARAGSQKVTVVPSITANVRQVLGNGLMLGSNANLGADNVSLALRTQLARYADLEDEGLDDMMDAEKDEVWSDADTEYFIDGKEVNI